MDKTMRKLKARFLELSKAFEEYSKTGCSLCKDGTCRHPSMGWGGMATDTECRLDNCPFILDEKIE
jgi:hypothetical protein